MKKHKIKLGRPKVSYKTTTIRVPLPLKERVERMIELFKFKTKKEKQS